MLFWRSRQILSPIHKLRSRSNARSWIMPPKTKRVKDEDHEETPKKSKKPKADTTAHVDEFGFHVYDPATILYKDYDTKPNKKIAGFDMDGTLILVKSGNQFPRGPDDWKWFSKKVVGVVQDLHKNGHKIVIFSNQGAIKSAVTGKGAANIKTKLNNIVKELGVPAVAIVACGDDNFRKPGTGMWDFVVEKLNGGVKPDIPKCFFVGDMAGRATDPNQSTTDKDFAEKIGVEFKVPEDMFGEMEGKKVLPAKKPASADGGATQDDGPNPELVGIFKELADLYFKGDGKNDKFKAISAKKVAAGLSGYPKKVELSNLKEVGTIAGIGKGSLAMIKEYVETGKVQSLEELKSGGGGSPKKENAVPAKPSKAQEAALKFM